MTNLMRNLLDSAPRLAAFFQRSLNIDNIRWGLKDETSDETLFQRFNRLVSDSGWFNIDNLRFSLTREPRDENLFQQINRVLTRLVSGSSGVDEHIWDQLAATFKTVYTVVTEYTWNQLAVAYNTVTTKIEDILAVSVIISLGIVVLAISLWWYYKHSDIDTKPDYDNASLRSDDTDLICDSESLLAQVSSRDLNSSTQEAVSSSSVDLPSVSTSLAETDSFSKDTETEKHIQTGSDDESTSSNKTQPEDTKADHLDKTTSRIEVLEITNKTLPPISELTEHTSSITINHGCREKKPSSIPEILDRTPPLIVELTELASSTAITDGYNNRKLPPILEITEKTPSLVTEDMKHPPTLVIQASVQGIKPRQMPYLLEGNKMAILPEQKLPPIPEKTEKTEKNVFLDNNLLPISEKLDSKEIAVFPDMTLPSLPEMTYMNVIHDLTDKKPMAISEETDLNENTVLPDKNPTAEVADKPPTLITESTNEIRSASKIAMRDKLPAPISEKVNKNKKAFTSDKTHQDLSKADKIGTALLLDKKLPQMQPGNFQKVTFPDETTPPISERLSRNEIPILLDKKKLNILEKTDKKVKGHFEDRKPPPIPIKPYKMRQISDTGMLPTPVAAQISSSARKVSDQDKKIPQVPENTNLNEIVIFKVKNLSPTPEKPNKNGKDIFGAKTSESPTPERTENRPPPISEQMTQVSFSVENAGLLEKKQEPSYPKSKDMKSLPVLEKQDQSVKPISGKQDRIEIAILDKKIPPTGPTSDTDEIKILSTEPPTSPRPDKNKKDLFLEKKPPPFAEMSLETPTTTDNAGLPEEKLRPIDPYKAPQPILNTKEQAPSPTFNEGSYNIFNTSDCPLTTLSSVTRSSPSRQHKDAITPSNLFISAHGSKDQSSSGTAVSHVLCGRIYHIGQYIPGNGDNLQVLESLGSGTQATVYKVSDGKSTFAVKISSSDDFSPELLSEYKILSSLHHKNVVAVYGEIPRGFVLDCHSNNLKTFINNSGHILPRVRNKLAIGILEGVNYIHSKGIAHLDIKPDNVLLTAYKIPKLCDFGLAVRYTNPDGSMFDIGRFYGTAHYASPEMYRKGWFASEDIIDLPKTDCWSVGVTLFRLMTGQPLFIGANDMEIFRNQRDNNFNYPPLFADLSPLDVDYYSFMEMIKGLCKNAVDARLSTREALNHECFK